MALLLVHTPVYEALLPQLLTIGKKRREKKRWLEAQVTSAPRDAGIAKLRACCHCCRVGACVALEALVARGQGAEGSSAVVAVPVSGEAWAVSLEVARGGARRGSAWVKVVASVCAESVARKCCCVHELAERPRAASRRRGWKRPDGGVGGDAER